MSTVLNMHAHAHAGTHKHIPTPQTFLAITLGDTSKTLTSF